MFNIITALWHYRLFCPMKVIKNGFCSTAVNDKLNSPPVVACRFCSPCCPIVVIDL